MTKRSPNWTFDETLIVAELSARYGWKYLDPKHPEVIEISKLLQKAPIHDPSVRGEKFRNPVGVSLKMGNIYTRRADYKGVQSRGSKIDGDVLEYFERNPQSASAEALKIRKLIDMGQYEHLGEHVDPDFGEYEGRQMLTRHYRRERSQKLRQQKINSHKDLGLALDCEACGFNFEEKYGARGEGFIEIHHVLPLYMADEGTRTKLEDLALLCANCHRMVHRSNLISIRELVQVLENVSKF